MKRLRVYELYRNGLGLFSRSQGYRSGDEILQVRAKSIKQAYFFAGNDYRAAADGREGVLSSASSNRLTRTYAE